MTLMANDVHHYIQRYLWNSACKGPVKTGQYVGCYLCGEIVIKVCVLLPYTWQMLIVFSGKSHGQTDLCLL